MATPSIPIRGKGVRVGVSDMIGHLLGDGLWFKVRSWAWGAGIDLGQLLETI